MNWSNNKHLLLIVFGKERFLFILFKISIVSRRCIIIWAFNMNQFNQPFLYGSTYLKWPQTKCQSLIVVGSKSEIIVNIYIVGVGILFVQNVRKTLRANQLISISSIFQFRIQIFSKQLLFADFHRDLVWSSHLNCNLAILVKNANHRFYI